ncbi:rod shape-determining protein RodA [bacterium]|nr:rod shape-determining protein RodA [bacterium]MBU1025948.1 rod shape-determining protein RodA [bacterium]
MRLLWKNDQITFFLAVIISLGGILAIVSSEGGFLSGLPYLAKKQLIFLVVGIVLYVVFSFINYQKFASITLIIYGCTFLILAAVLAFGAIRGGSERWILIGSYQFQPSEISKLLMIIVLARFFTRLKGHFSDVWVFLFVLGALVPILFMIVIEPDLGMTILLFLIFLFMSFVSRLSWKFPVTLVLIGTLMVPAAWPLMKDYQKNRIISFLNPASDPLGKGYQSNQSKIAIGSGGVTGLGFFKGTQNKLDFIPSQSTDFIFSIVGEEGGFFSTTLVVFLYLLLFLRLGTLALKVNDDYGSMIVWGICAMLFIQTFVNIGMTIGIMPVTGIPLPFMSAGINSLLVNFIALGVANSVYKYSDFSKPRKSQYVRIR